MREEPEERLWSRSDGARNGLGVATRPEIRIAFPASSLPESASGSARTRLAEYREGLTKIATGVLRIGSEAGGTW